jgi:hypothetical protein
LAGIEAGAVWGCGVDGPIGVLVKEVGIVVLVSGVFGDFCEKKFFLEDGIGLEFGLEKGLEFEGGGLQELQRLLDLWGNSGGLAKAGLER